MQAKDVSDLHKELGREKLLPAIQSHIVDAQPEERLIEFKRPSELKNFIPPPGILLIGDCHIVRGSVFVIGGAPGVGKSRGSVALAVAGASGGEWFGLR